MGSMRVPATAGESKVAQLVRVAKAEACCAGKIRPQMSEEEAEGMAEAIGEGYEAQQEARP